MRPRLAAGCGDAACGGATRQVTSLEVLASMRALLLGHADGSLSIWNLSVAVSGDPLWMGPTGKHAVTALAVLRGDVLLAVGNAAGGLTLWNLRQLRQVSSAVLDGAARSAPQVQCLAASPHGDALAVGTSTGLFLVEVREGALMLPQKLVGAPAGAITGLAWSSCTGELIAACGTGSIVVLRHFLYF